MIIFNYKQNKKKLEDDGITPSQIVETVLYASGSMETLTHKL